MKADLLSIEVDLLFLKYGDDAVLKAIAGATNVSVENVKQKISLLEIQTQNRVNKAKPKKTAIDIVKEIISGSENEDCLLELASKFQNRRFLPELKDVKRFAERNGIIDKIHSRESGAKSIFKRVVQFDRHQLQDLLKSTETNDQSAFAMLSKQIIEGEREQGN